MVYITLVIKSGLSDQQVSTLLQTIGSAEPQMSASKLFDDERGDDVLSRTYMVRCARSVAGEGVKVLMSMQDKGVESATIAPDRHMC